jgi:hypothetical protein
MRLRLSPAACKTAIIVGVSFAAGIGFILACEQFQAQNGKQSAAQPAAENASVPSVAPVHAMEMGGELIPAPLHAGTQASYQRGRDPSVFGSNVESGQTVSGYPMAAGRKAVEYIDPQQGAYTGAQDPSTTAGWAPDDYTVAAQRVGRNGLVSNPCVDPPSSHGAAYSRSY